MSSPSLEPVVVKLYGMVRLTRKRYVLQLVVALVCVVGLLIGWFVFRSRVDHYLRNRPVEVVRHLIMIHTAFPWVVGGLGLLQILEAAIVFRLFRKKEAERAAGEWGT